MRRNEKLKRLLSYVFTLLLLLVIVMGPTTIKADAAATTGIAIGVVGAVAAALAAWGIGTAAQNMTTSGVSGFFNSTLQSWANSVGETIETLIPAAAIGISPTGAMILNNAAVLGIRAYATWLQQQNGLVDGGNSIPVVNATLIMVPYSESTPTKEEMISRGLVTYYRDNATCYIMSNVQNTYAFRYSNTQRVIASTTSFTFWQYDTQTNVVQRYSTYYDNSTGVYFNTANFVEGNSNLYNYSSKEAGLAAVASGTGMGSMQLVPSDVIGIPTVDDIGEESYVVDFGGTAGLTVDQAAQEVLEKVVANELTSSGEIEQEQTNVTWPDITTPVAVVGLQNVFPFCIPFDIVDFLRVMNATREAPEIDWPIVIPSLNFSYTIEIDLSGFNQVASILRTMELLIFIVGLAFITRSMIIRG